MITKVSIRNIQFLQPLYYMELFCLVKCIIFTFTSKKMSATDNIFFVRNSEI
jgi:hypothetical protein